MSEKSKKTSIWHICSKCQAKFCVKDLPVHQKKSCPPPEKLWCHPYVKGKILFTSLGEFDNGATEATQYFARTEHDHMIWLSREVLRLNRWNIGDPVIVGMKGYSVVKTVWPYRGKSVMGAVMKREVIEGTWGICKGEVKIKQLLSQPPLAKQVVVGVKSTNIERQIDANHITSLLNSLYSEKYLQVGSKLWLPYYGKRLLIIVKSIICENDMETSTLESGIGDTPNTTLTSENLCFKNEVFSSTPKRSPRCITGSVLAEKACTVRDDSFSHLDGSGSLLQDSLRKSENMDSSIDLSLKNIRENPFGGLQQFDVSNSLCAVSDDTDFILEIENAKTEVIKECTTMPSIEIDVFGLQTLKMKLFPIISKALDNINEIPSLRQQRGILLHGPSGTGKTYLARSLARDFGLALYEMQSADIYSKFIGETESRIKQFFEKAKSDRPALILLDKIDWLSSSNLNTSGATDLGRRAVDNLALNLDRLHDCESSIVVLATACSLDAVDATLRRPGRLECEEEMPLPGPDVRLNILNAVLAGIPHSLTQDDLQQIANCTHGFVGGDLISLGSHALLHTSTLTRSQLNYEDFNWALRRVSPSAMKQVLLDIPNVHWSDIAGQEDLKLKLRQSVEWPLTHPEAFARLGIRPPRGILMYGPPGCSKTMIAKAVATESKLNFITIKGSEIFSKWVGESERAVRDVFRRARQVAPSIVFFDELDAIAGERFTTGTRNIESRVLTQLLTEMDGVEELGKVIVIGATNRPDRIDKALLRPGRMDNVVYVPLPDNETREEIFRRQTEKMPVSFTDLDVLVENTAGYSGAEVVAVCHEAGRRALMEDISAQVVREDHFIVALKEIKPRTPALLLELYEKYQKRRM